MLAQHITLESDQVITEFEIIPDYTIEYEDSDWPLSNIAEWHWIYNHFDN